MRAADLLLRLRKLANPQDAANLQRFFKTGPGEYGEGDVFLGIRVPAIRELAREFRGQVAVEEAVALLQSEVHEARMLALFLLVDVFQRGDESVRREVYRTYLAQTGRINNWDLVDLSAPQIVGGWLASRDRKPLYRLAASAALWERRIAVLATFTFIRQGDFADILALAERLLHDEHDLLHKALGWMLREVGKREAGALEAFLDRHATTMPRTMLRYAVEKFPEPRRRHYMRREGGPDCTRRAAPPSAT